MMFVATAVAAGLVAGGGHGDPGTRSAVADFATMVVHAASRTYALRMAAVFMISLATIWLKTALMPRWLYQAAENHHRPVASPWIVGMVMIGIGLTALTLAWIQHRQETNALRAQDPRLPYSLAGIMAGLIAILGLLALVTVAWRL
jgi:hypothetical protein